MHAVCSRAGRHTRRPGRLWSLRLPGQATHAHKTGTYTSPRMRVQRVLTPAKESAEKGMFLGKKAGGRGWRREEGSNRAACRPDNNKDGKRDFQRRSGCTQRGAPAWPHPPAGARLVPWGTTAIRERLRVLPQTGLGSWGRKAAAGSGGDTLESTSGLMEIKGLAILPGVGGVLSRKMPGVSENSHSTLGRSWALTCTPLPAGANGKERDIFILPVPPLQGVPTCQSYTGAQPCEGRCQGPEKSGLNAEKAPWCLPVLSPPLAAQGHVLTGTGIHHCACAQVVPWLVPLKEGDLGPERPCLPSVPERRQDGLPLRAEACSGAGDWERAEPPPPLSPTLPHKPPPPGISTPAPGLPRKRKQGTGDTPGSGEVREASSCPDRRG